MQDKLVERARKELIDLHKRVLLNYLISKGLEYPIYKKFFILYDHTISTSNIQKYFHMPCHIFVRALILDKLKKVAWVSTIGDKNLKRKRKHTIKF